MLYTSSIKLLTLLGKTNKQAVKKPYSKATHDKHYKPAYLISNISSSHIILKDNFVEFDDTIKQHTEFVYIKTMVIKLFSCISI